MKKWFKRNASIVFFCIAVITLMVSAVGAIIIIGSDDEHIVITDKIVSVKLIEDDETFYDILELTFTKGDKYLIKNINMVDYDFTVNSKFIIKLFRPDADSYWNIIKMYKVPG